MKLYATLFFLVIITVFTFWFKKQVVRQEKEKATEIGKNFVVRPLFISGYGANTTTIEVMTERGNKGSVTLNMYVNEVKDYLYEIKVEGIDSVSFVRTRSRYHP